MVIEGGYYIKARCIQQSAIANAPPHIREIWDWILQNANHKDTRVCQRGQLIRTYKDIIDGLSWYVGWRKESYSRWDCEKAMKWLRKADMIATKKTTAGILINIVKYDYYQNPRNYEDHTKATPNATREPQTRHTINKNDKNVKNINISVADQKSKPSGFRKLDDLLGKKQTGGAAYEWQDKAARMAKALNFKPGPSWFKLFKQAAAEGHTGLLDSTYSKIADLNPINPEKYFYKVYYAND